jgi:hypothetical protein
MIFGENGANLAYLIWFGHRTIALKVRLLFNTFFSEDVVATLNSFFESESPQKFAQIREADIRI